MRPNRSYRQALQDHLRLQTTHFVQSHLIDLRLSADSCGIHGLAYTQHFIAQMKGHILQAK